MRRLFYFCFLVSGFCFAAAADIIPTNRITTWRGHVGVEGGIPDSSSMEPYGSPITPEQGVEEIRSRIANCPSNQVVELTAGTFDITRPIEFYRNGVVLRGAGPTNTVLNFKGAESSGIAVVSSLRYGCVDQGLGSGCKNGEVWNISPDNVVNWTSGFAKGSTNITLSSTNGLYVGALIFLDQLNDNIDVGGHGIENCGRDTSFIPLTEKRSQMQAVKVRSIGPGTTITISDPIAMSNWRLSQTPQVWWQNNPPREMCGLENMTINGAEGYYGGGGLMVSAYFAGAYNCWVKNVESLYGGGNMHIYFDASAHCEVRHCALRYTLSLSSMSYGLGLFYSSHCLIEDNNSDDVITLLNGGACSANAITYNYFTNSPRWDPDKGWWPQGMVVMHDAHQCMNLLEGNCANQFHTDHYHGSGAYDTCYRNYFSGEDRSAIAEAANALCISIETQNRYMNIVGNVLGKHGWTATYDGVVPCILGKEDGADNQDSLVTLYWHGNFDEYHDAILWASTNADHDLPASLLYDTKPSWWGDYLEWPPYNPTDGSSITANLNARTNIPAGYRYVYGIDPPPLTNNQPPVIASASAAPPVGAAPLTVVFTNSTTDADSATLSYTWTFGDGGTAATAGATNTFGSAGVFTNRLAVSDGYNTARTNVIVTVTNSPDLERPVAPTNLAISVAASGTTVTLGWEAGSCTNVITNYAVSYGLASSFPHGSSANSGTNLTCTLTNLTALRTYYFSVRALDENGLYSTNSRSANVLTLPANGTTFYAVTTNSVIVWPMITDSGYIHQSTNYYNGTNGMGSAMYRFEVTNAGNYRLLVDSFAAGAGDTFWITVDALPVPNGTNVCDLMPQRDTGVAWTNEVPVTWRGSYVGIEDTNGTDRANSQVKVWTLSSNVHTLYVIGRESGAGLYQFKFVEVGITPPEGLRIIRNPADMVFPYVCDVPFGGFLCEAQSPTGATAMTFTWYIQNSSNSIPDGLAPNVEGGNVWETETNSFYGPMGMAIEEYVTNYAAQYYCVVSNSAGMATSSVATMTITTNVLFQLEPTAQTVVAGAPVYFNSWAVPNANLTYRWLFNGVAITNANDANYSIEGALAGDAGSYQVIVSNLTSVATSATAELIVVAPPQMVAQPTNQSAIVTSNITLQAAASANYPTVKMWYKDGVRVDGYGMWWPQGSGSGSHSSAAYENGDYYLVVSNAAGSVTSETAHIEVVIPRPPPVVQRAFGF